MKTAEAHNAGLIGKIDLPIQRIIAGSKLDKELIEGIIPNPPPPDAHAVELVEWFSEHWYKVQNE
jgi:hypothetical protein